MHKTPHMPIAIIGIGCSFPGGALNPSQLWKLLSEGFDGIIETPKDRWDSRRFYHQNPQMIGKMHVNRGGFLKEPIDLFDANFFKISPREADSLDPQQRILLETSWKAFEDANLIPSSLKGTQTGVFIGGFTSDWQNLNYSPHNIALTDLYTGINASQTVLSARLSHFYDLKGPCLTTDTACSSSLVAIHLACNSLKNGECTLAIAGGVNLMIQPNTTVAMSKGRFLSPDGKCRSFDKDGKGYVRGEGAGIVILKPLEDAIRDHNLIYAVIQASGINHDGYTNGLAMPNSEAQKNLIKTVLEKAAIDPLNIQYVEAHGTGTKAGDPAETWALDQVLKGNTKRETKCFIGSIKSNIGHLEAAAGVAGLIKAALCLKHRKIPPNLHFESPNPDIPFHDNCLKVPLTLSDFPEPQKHLYASVNSFGYGGTNAHAILSEYVVTKQVEISSIASINPSVYPLSAHNDHSLKEAAESFATFLRENPNTSLTSLTSLQGVANTLLNHKERFQKQIAIIASSREDLIHKLGLYTKDESSPCILLSDLPATKAKIAYVFTGMGPQWHGMGKELIKSSEVFKGVIERCSEILFPFTGWSLKEELAKDENNSNIEKPVYAQPANFAIQAALFELLKSKNLKPQGLIGHSIGEVAAAYASGAITLEEGITLSYKRACIQSKRQDLGTMLAAELSEIEAEKIALDYPLSVSIAAINSPSSVTFSGELIALKEIAEKLDERSLFNRLLNVNIAYHSSQMDGLREDVLNDLKNLHPKETKIPLYSTVDAKQTLDADYWWNNIRQPVLFKRGIETMIDQGYNLFIEIGPHPVLGNSIKEIIKQKKAEAQTLYTLNKKEDEPLAILRLLAKLHMAGVSSGLNSLIQAPFSQTTLPCYSWDKKRCWTESESSKQYIHSLNKHQVLSTKCLTSPSAAYLTEINDGFFPWLNHHEIEELTVFPGAGYIEAALALYQDINGSARCILEDVAFLETLAVEGGKEPLLRTSLKDSSSFEIHSSHSKLESAWTLHATGHFAKSWNGFIPPRCDIKKLKESLTSSIPSERLYEEFHSLGMQYGEKFQLITSLFTGDGEALSLIDCQDQEKEAILYPPILDAAFQTLLGTHALNQAEKSLSLPVKIKSLSFFSSPKGTIYCHAIKTSICDQYFTGNLKLYNDEGTLLVEAIGVTCQMIKPKRLHSKIDNILYRTKWNQYHAIQSNNEIIEKGKKWAIYSTNNALLDKLTIYFASLEINLQNPELFSDYLLFYDEGVPPLEVNTNASHALLEMIQKRELYAQGIPYTLFVITKGMYNLSDNVSSSLLKGLLSVIRNELTHIDCRFIDIDCCKGNITAEMVLEPVLNSITNATISFKDGAYYTPQLEMIPDIDQMHNECGLSVNAEKDPFCLEISKAGSIDNLYFRQTSRVKPQSHEVEIKVHTTSLNFKDVMKVLGLLNEKVLRGTYFGNTFGMECSGTVVAIGSKVKAFKLGDKVVAFTPNAFSSFLTLNKDCLCKIPNGTNLESAPCLIPFITVIRGLKEVAQLKKGETILIHTATGAVGLAAIQYAKHIGAKIIATAGSPEKRTFLSSLGIDYIADSRTTQFQRQIEEWTMGRGCDVILNALSGDFLFKSWSLIAPYGRFIEIGKRDIGENALLPMEVFNRNATFASIDLDRTFAEDKSRILKLLTETHKLFEKKVFTPLPYLSYPVSEIKEAFQYVAKAKHIGKVVVSFDSEYLKAAPKIKSSSLFSSDATYLVTGGHSGFGLATAEWIVKNGGKHLILLSRRGEQSNECKEAVKLLRRIGAKIKSFAVDVGNFEELKNALDKSQCNQINSKHPLKGVFHAAMVLDDAFIMDLNPSRFDKVIYPKANGCLNLHLLTNHLTLDYFVLYSSISSIIGNPGQASYSAANAFFDHFSSYRSSLGKPSLTINWGAIGEKGVLARDSTLALHLKNSGIHQIPLEKCFKALESLLRLPINYVSQCGIMDIDWALLLKSLPSLKQDSLFSSFVNIQQETKGSNFATNFTSLDSEGKLSKLIELLQDKVATTLRIDREKIDTQVKLNTIGMDSLMAMELQHQIEQKLGCRISTMELIKGPSIQDLSKLVLKLI